MMCKILSPFCLTYDTEIAAHFEKCPATVWRSTLNIIEHMRQLCVSSPSLSSQCHRPAWYLYATCWLVLNWSTARIMQKPKEPRLPASHHLAQTHHVNFMTTACYRCQFFRFESDSLGHPQKPMAFIFYDAVFCLYLMVSMKDLGRDA